MANAVYTVVLVEDDVPLRELTRLVLEQSGRFRVLAEASDGSEGIRAAAEHRPDIVLLDLAMPKMNGFQALPELRRLTPRSRIIALSMLQRDKNEAEALARGAFAFIDKGNDSRELVNSLLGLLEPPSGSNPSQGGGGPTRGRWSTSILPGVVAFGRFLRQPLSGAPG